MDLPVELKKRFCEDCCIPIDVYEEPYFQSRLELYDRFYNTIERYNNFVQMISERYTTYEYEAEATLTPGTLNPPRRGTVTASVCGLADEATEAKLNVKFQGEDADNTVESVELSDSEVYVYIGDSKDITASISPTTVDDKNIIWESNNTSLATVRYGRITTDTYKTSWTSENITNNSNIIKNVPVRPGTLSLRITGKVTDVKYEDNEKGKFKDSSGEIVKGLTIDYTTGVIKGLSGQNILASYTADSSDQYTDENAKDGQLNHIPVKKGSVKLTVTPNPEISDYKDDKSGGFVVASTNSAVSGAAIDYTSGKVTGIDADKIVASYEANLDKTCTVTAYSNKDKSKNARCTVHVVNKTYVSGITLTFHETYIQIGKQEQLEWSVSPLSESGVSTATNTDLTWSSSDTNVAKVSSNGLVTAIGSGVAYITATSDYTEDGNKITDSCKVVVSDRIRVRQVLLNKNSMTIKVGTIDKSLYAKISPTTATHKAVTWYSSDTSIAQVVDRNGDSVYNNVCVIKAVAKGNCTIYCMSNEDNTMIAHCALTVVEHEFVKEISIERTSGTEEEIKLGIASVKDIVSFKSKISVGYGVNPKLKWQSSNVRIAAIGTEDTPNTGTDDDKRVAYSYEPTFVSATVQPEDYYNDYCEIMKKLCMKIKGTDGYKDFINKSSSDWPIKCTCGNPNLYIPELDGHLMISVDIVNPLFSPLYYFDHTIFDDHEVWADYVSTVGETDNEHIIYSENLLKDVICRCNQSKVEAFGRYQLDQFYKDILTTIINPTEGDSYYKDYVNLVYFGKSRFVLDVTGMRKIENLNPDGMLNRAMRLYQSIKRKAARYMCSDSHATSPFPLNVRLFTMYKLKSEVTSTDGEGDDATTTTTLVPDITGYAENIYYETNEPINFVDVDHCQLPILMRTFSRQSLQDNDKRFVHHGLYAQFTDDKKIYVPPISTIPDSSVFDKDDDYSANAYYYEENEDVE